MTDELLEKYDKIYPLGHLSLYRNTQEVNLRWRLPESRYDIHDVLTKPDVFAFDEWRGIHNIYMRKGFPFYRNVDFASPIAGTYRYKFANRSNPKYERNPDNYEQMCFYWEDGKVFRAFNAGSRRKPDIRTDEFVYMHFLKRRFPNAPTQECLDARAFFCSPQGFFPKERLGTPTIEEIMMYNPLPKGGRIVEMLQSLLGRLRKLKSKIEKKLFKKNKQGTFAERDNSLHELRKW